MGNCSSNKDKCIYISKRVPKKSINSMIDTIINERINLFDFRLNDINVYHYDLYDLFSKAIDKVKMILLLDASLLLKKIFSNKNLITEGLYQIIIQESRKVISCEELTILIHKRIGDKTPITEFNLEKMREVDQNMADAFANIYQEILDNNKQNG